jgi:hypothetical protein
VCADAFEDRACSQLVALYIVEFGGRQAGSRQVPQVDVLVGARRDTLDDYALVC